MKIIFVESYPQVVYGQQRTLLSLLGAARKAGHYSIVACTSEGPFVDAVSTSGEETAILAYPNHLATYGGAIYNYSWRRKFSLSLQLLSYVCRLRRWLKMQRPDVVFCNDMRGLLTMGIAARLAGIPVVIWDKLDKPHGFLDWFQLPIANLNFIISDSVKQKYPRWQSKVWNKKIIKLYDGTDINSFDSIGSQRENFGFSNNDFVAIILASISHRKGQDRILSLLPRLKAHIAGFKLLIVGAVEDSEESKEFYASLENKEDSSVHFLGYREDARELIKSSDVLILPSRNEGMPLVFGEAWALGKPVVSADVSGAQEVVINGTNGFLFNGDDPTSIITSLVASSNQDFLNKVKITGPQFARKFFDKDNQHALFFNNLQDLINRKSK